MPTTHGLSKHPLYTIWFRMIERCTKPKDKAYRNYGRRGIKVCDRWLIFKNFLEDMDNRPNKKYSLDRINNDKGYYKENCKWSTFEEQRNNTRYSPKVTFDGVTKTIGQWASIFKISKRFKRSFHNRIVGCSWSLWKAACTPALSPVSSKGVKRKHKQLNDQN